MKLAYMAELLLKTAVEEGKLCQKAPVGQGAQKLDNRVVE